ncbi:MAG TPA: HAMP domain-containing sensor histidine kinase [Saprospiraceae bacterium]|nr:HAMP domain-containing sensor histidine kinase [Saprospiraceae bacterium]
MQIRTRLSLSFFAIAACILAGLFAYVYWMFKKDAQDVFFQTLRSKATVAEQTLIQDAPRLATLPPVIGNDEDTLPYRDNISLYNQAYQRVFSAQSEAPEIGVKVIQSALAGQEIRTEHHNLEALARLIYTDKGQPYVLVVEGFFDKSNTDRLRNLLIFSFLIGLLILLATTWHFAGRALRPVDLFMEQVESLSPARPERRLEIQGETHEIARLAEKFNEMLDRVEKAFGMQRMFLSNVSHELKNPLTAIRAQIEVALQREREPAAYQKALKSVLDDITLIGEVEEKLLQLARLYNDPSGIPMEAVRLDELLWLAKEQLQKNHPEYHVSIDLQALPEHADLLLVDANEPLLRTALLNLMNNACKYAPDHSTEVVAVFSNNGAHRISICDNGPGIPEEERNLIFEPFYRSPRHRNLKGTGVGLSLTRSILDLHRISIEASNRPGGGAEFTLVFTGHS